MTAPTLPEFILARVAEWEAEVDAMLGELGWLAQARRLEGQCAAYRSIVALHSEDREQLFGHPVDYECTGTYDAGMADPEDCATLRAVAAIWSDHPDYRAIADLIDPRPCAGVNANVCAAEGCFGGACAR